MQARGLCIKGAAEDGRKAIPATMPPALFAGGQLDLSSMGKPFTSLGDERRNMGRLASLPLVAALVLLAATRALPEILVCAGFPPGRASPPHGVAAKEADVLSDRVPSRGRLHALVIFAQFADEKSDDLSVPAYAGELFAPDVPGSLTHFYHTMSFGELTLEGTVLPKRYTSDQPAAAYLPSEPDEPGRFGQFVTEILRQVDRDIDFARFDNDGPDGVPDSGDDDGAVDHVFVCVRSTPHGFLKAAATGIAGLGFRRYNSQDGRNDGEVVWIWGTPFRGAVGREGSFAQTVGMLAHEFGHSLGLPDLYDLDYARPADDSAGIGRWGLMGWGAGGWNGNDGPNPFCAWSLEQLGWISPDNGRVVEVTTGTPGMVLESVHPRGVVLKVPRSLLSPLSPPHYQEYLLVEHRTRSASFYSRSLPAEGLLIWHIRPQVMAAEAQYGNNDEDYKAVDLLCADGLYRDAGYPLGQEADPDHGSDNLDFWAHDAAYREVHGGNLGDATDPHDGVRFTRLDPWTNPSSAPPEFPSFAPSVLSLSLRRHGDAMVVDVVPNRRAEVTFEVPGYEVREGSAMVPAGQAAPIRVTVPGEVDTADLVAYAVPHETRAAEIPMVRQATTGEGQVFAATFRPPEEGVYQLLVRVRDPDGGVVLSEAALHLWATLLRELGPALLFLGDLYTAAGRDALRQMLEEALAAHGLGADCLLAAPHEGPFYEAVLAHQKADRALVVWSGQSLDERGQAVLRTLLERGGRLLLISHEFHTSPGSGAFLANLLYATAQKASGSRVYRSTPQLHDPIEFPMQPGCWLELTAPSVPLLIDEDAHVGAMRVDTGAYRVVYLPFDVYAAGTATQRFLIESSLAFLLEPARLELSGIIAPPVTVPLGPVTPQVAVTNWGPQDSEGFQVRYQVLLGDEVVGTGAQTESRLDALAEREIALPVWGAAEEGAYRIRFGLGAPDQAELVYGPPRPLYAAGVGEAFAVQPLPGALSQGRGTGWFDYDNDGDLDLYLVRWMRPNELFRNEGTDFTQQAEAAGLAVDSYGRGLAIGDYDGDGDLDLYVVVYGIRGAPNRFFRNEGDGTFADVTSELDADPATARPLGDLGAGCTAGFFDHDLDGDLDLYLVNSERHGRNRLYRNEERGFEEDAAAAGLDHRDSGPGLALGDYDGDGDVDLFLANEARGSQLCRNDRGTFVDVHTKLGIDVVGSSSGGVFGDCDNDGDLDLFVTNSTGPNQLFRNHGGVSFAAATPGEGLSLGQHASGAAFFDHDNDGDLDLVATTPDSSGGDQLFHNLGRCLLPVGHLLALQPESEGRGVTFGDYDQDGDIDWFVADQQRSRLYRNQAAEGNWLQVDLSGIGLNPDGLGARVDLSAQGNKQYQEVQSAYGYCSAVQPWPHFGLAAAAKVDTLRVRWPDGQETLQTDVAADQRFVVQHPSLITAVLEDHGGLPTSFELWPNYPNPFNPSTVIPFSVPDTPGGAHALITIAIYDLLGQKVRTLISEELGPGLHRTTWDARDDRGRQLATGVYLCQLRAGGLTQTRKLAVIR